jgi:hypothetical protein
MIDVGPDRAFKGDGGERGRWKQKVINSIGSSINTSLLSPLLGFSKDPMRKMMQKEPFSDEALTKRH